MSSENQSTATSRVAVRNWTDEEKEIVWEQACQAKEENLPLTEAFRRVAKLLPHRSEAAVGMLYYNVLRKEREEPSLPTKPKSTMPTATPEFKVDTRLLEAFQGLPEYIQELNQKMNQFEERLQTPDPTAILRALSQLITHQNTEGNYSAQIKSLQAENEALQSANQALQKDLQRLKQAYEDALGIYDMFTNMASISQIMSLGDFKQQMKTTLDKWGNVLEITFDRTV